MLAALLALGAACEVGGQVGAADLVVASGDGSSSTAAIDAAPERSTTTVAGLDEFGTSTSSDGDDADGVRFDLGAPGDVLDTSGSDGSDGSAGKTGATCCEAMLEPGCSDPELEACVCEADAFCCEQQWDAACVDIAMFGACVGGCLLPEPPAPEHCCVAGGGAGCLDPEIEACVCAQDPYCCSYTWDDVCVGYVESFGCGTCE